MEITQQVRDYAAQTGLDDAAAVQKGLEEKAAEFRKEREIYVAVTAERAPRRSG